MGNISENNNIIGIPRALSYWGNYPFYYGFLTSLGFKVVLSDKTTTKLINEGAKYVVSDTCLPIKVYIGHLLNLLEKGVETIFVPSLQSTGYKINHCSKVRGLPEIVRNVINKPFRMIEPTLDKTEGLGIRDFCFETAKQLGIENSEKINIAIEKAWETYDNFVEMVKSGVAYETAVKNAVEGKFETKSVELVRSLSVVIMAHGYNLYDERISMHLLKKLDKMGVKVYTGLRVSKDEAIKSIHELGEIQYWANELDLTGAAAHYMLSQKVDGIIALSAFGCGPDSLMVDEIQYHANERNMPMLHLTIDEHTGEAGFVTRLEAFIDMLMRKQMKNAVKQKKNNITNIAPVERERVLTKV